LESQAVSFAAEQKRRSALQLWRARTQASSALRARVQKWAALRARRERKKSLLSVFDEWRRKFLCEVHLAHLQLLRAQRAQQSCFATWLLSFRRERHLRRLERVLAPRVASLRRKDVLVRWQAALRCARLDSTLQVERARINLGRMRLREVVRKWRAKVRSRSDALALEERSYTLSKRAALRRAVRSWRQGAVRSHVMHVLAPLWAGRREDLLMRRVFEDWSRALTAARFDADRCDRVRQYAIQTWRGRVVRRKSLCVALARSSLHVAQRGPRHRLAQAWGVWKSHFAQCKAANDFRRSNLAYSALAHWRKRLQLRHLYLARWKRLVRASRWLQAADERVISRAAVMLQWDHTGLLTLRHCIYSSILPLAFAHPLPLQLIAPFAPASSLDSSSDVSLSDDDASVMDHTRLSVLGLLFRLWRAQRPQRRRAFMASEWAGRHTLRRLALAWREQTRSRKAKNVLIIQARAAAAVASASVVWKNVATPAAAAPILHGQSLSDDAVRGSLSSSRVASVLDAVDDVLRNSGSSVPLHPSSPSHPPSSLSSTMTTMMPALQVPLPRSLRPAAQLESQALSLWRRRVEARSWSQWQSAFVAHVLARQAVARAEAHFARRVLPVTWQAWQNHVRERRVSNDLADRAYACLLRRRCFYVWSNSHQSVQEQRAAAIELQQREQQHQQQQQLEDDEHADDLATPASLMLEDGAYGAAGGAAAHASLLSLAESDGATASLRHSFIASRSSGLDHTAPSVPSAPSSQLPAGDFVAEASSGTDAAAAAKVRALTLEEVLASFPTPTHSLQQSLADSRAAAASERAKAEEARQNAIAAAAASTNMLRATLGGGGFDGGSSLFRRSEDSLNAPTALPQPAAVGDSLDASFSSGMDMAPLPPLRPHPPPLPRPRGPPLDLLSLAELSPSSSLLLAHSHHEREQAHMRSRSTGEPSTAVHGTAASLAATAAVVASQTPETAAVVAPATSVLPSPSPSPSPPALSLSVLAADDFDDDAYDALLRPEDAVTSATATAAAATERAANVAAAEEAAVEAERAQERTARAQEHERRQQEAQELLADSAYVCFLLRRSFARWQTRFEEACTGLSLRVPAL
jgi:hypothetical protein